MMHSMSWPRSIPGSRVVEMRYFAGLTIDETAQALDMSTATVEREWVMAKA
jgi:DNA-directed RNA polymerase specialized sigma24 family protein